MTYRTLTSLILAMTLGSTASAHNTPHDIKLEVPLNYQMISVDYANQTYQTNLWNTGINVHYGYTFPSNWMLFTDLSLSTSFPKTHTSASVKHINSAGSSSATQTTTDTTRFDIPIYGSVFFGVGYHVTDQLTPYAKIGVSTYTFRMNRTRNIATTATALSGNMGTITKVQSNTSSIEALVLGSTIGVGTQYQLSHQLYAKIEYQFGLASGRVDSDRSQNKNEKLNLRTHQISAGLSYRF